MSSTTTEGVPVRARYGDQISSTWKGLRVVADAGEVAPTDALQLVRSRPADRTVEFYVDVPAWVASCDVHVGRWVSVDMGGVTGGADIGEWIEDDRVSLSASGRVAVPGDGDHVGIYVDHVMGVADTVTHIQLAWRGLGRV